MSNPTLRNLLARPGMLVAPGAYDALGARTGRNQTDNQG